MTNFIGDLNAENIWSSEGINMITGGCRKLYSEKRHILQSSPDITEQSNKRG
jgi:hypothetical protein